jgi:hypothetical protein
VAARGRSGVHDERRVRFERLTEGSTTRATPGDRRRGGSSTRCVFPNATHSDARGKALVSRTGVLRPHDGEVSGRCGDIDRRHPPPVPGGFVKHWKFHKVSAAIDAVEKEVGGLDSYVQERSRSPWHIPVALHAQRVVRCVPHEQFPSVDRLSRTGSTRQGATRRADGGRVKHGVTGPTRG